jgi:hypothetical protein
MRKIRHWSYGGRFSESDYVCLIEAIVVSRFRDGLFSHDTKTTHINTAQKLKIISTQGTLRLGDRCSITVELENGDIVSGLPEYLLRKVE